MYNLTIAADPMIDALIEGYLMAHPDHGVDDALAYIFHAGVRSQLIQKLEDALIERNAQATKPAMEVSDVNLYP